jgi:hypothetical protein
MTAPIVFHMKALADRAVRSAAGIARLIHVPAAAAVSSLLGSEAASQAQCTAGVIKGRLTDQPPRSRLAVLASSTALISLKTASMASGLRIASSSSPASTSSW